MTTDVVALQDETIGVLPPRLRLVINLPKAGKLTDPEGPAPVCLPA